MSRIVVWKRMQLGDGSTADVVQVNQPHRKPEFESDVMVPAAQALIFGLTVGTGIAVAASWVSKGAVGLWPLWPILIGVFVGLGYLWRSADIAGTLWHVESMSVVAPEAAPQKPAQESERLLLIDPEQSRQEIRQETRAARQSEGAQELIDFARRCITVGTSEAAHGANSPATRQAYKVHRDALLDLGLAEWRSADSHKTGWRLTASVAKCEAVIKRHTSVM